MHKSKVLIGTLSILGLSLIPVGLVTSCSLNKEFYSSNDIGGLSTWLKSNQCENSIANAAKKVREAYKNDPDSSINGMTVAQANSLLNQKVIQISTGGKVNDNSFNQLVWETISSFSKSIGNENNRYYETLAIDQNMQNDAYDYAISNGFKVWILTGFQQETLLENWLKIGKNKERFDKEGIKIITVDWYSDKLTQPGRLLGLNFKAQESSFVVGYSAAKLVSEIYPGLDNIKHRYFNTFAGGDFSGATNFNYGFYEGMRRWNSEQKDDSTKVASTIVSNSVSVDLTTSFAITNDSRAKVNSAVDGYSAKDAPQVIMPVAGSLTSVALDRVKVKKSNQWVVGVDTDMSLSFPTSADLIITSSEKKIAIAVYKALSAFYGLSFALGDQQIQDIQMEWNDGTYSIKDKSSSSFANHNVTGGYAEGFVGVSKSTLNSNWKFDKDGSDESDLPGYKKGQTYAERFDQIVQYTWDKFFGKDKVSGIFEEEKPTPEQLAKGPAFYNNPKYGSMTAGNLDNYFNKVIFGDQSEGIVGINSWLPKKGN